MVVGATGGARDDAGEGARDARRVTHQVRDVDAEAVQLRSQHVAVAIGADDAERRDRCAQRGEVGGDVAGGARHVPRALVDDAQHRHLRRDAHGAAVEVLVEVEVPDDPDRRAPERFDQLEQATRIH